MLTEMQRGASSHLPNEAGSIAAAMVIDEHEFLEQIDRYRNPLG
jgi:hypothetical protein